jgi:hypothetical protein
LAIPFPELFVCHNNIAAEDWPDRIEPERPLARRMDGLPIPCLGCRDHLGCTDACPQSRRGARDDRARPVDIEVDHSLPGAAKSQAKCDAWKKVGYTHVPWVDPGKFRRAALPLDIGLAPLLSNDFTQGKSDVKAIEYVVSGAAPILQNMPVYNGNWIHGETCLLAGSAQEFLECTELLIRDESLRQKIVTNAQQYVREERGLKQLKDEWMAAVS